MFLRIFALKSSVNNWSTKFRILYKIQYIIVLFSSIRLLLQNYLINNNETELLIAYEDPGYYVGKHNTRIMVNITYASFAICYLLFISYYRFDRLQWLLNMNTIYNEFKTNSIESKTSKSIKKVIRVVKFVNIYNICLISFCRFFNEFI